MSCPVVEHVVTAAIKKCPFLSQLAEDHGEAYATSVAVNPRRPGAPVFPESLTDFKASFHLFHGASGVVPLVRSEQAASTQPAKCPFHAQQSDSPRAAPAMPISSDSTTQASLSPLTAAPFASASSNVFRFLPGPGDFIARRRRKRQEKQDSKADSKHSAARAKRPATSRARHFRLEKWQNHPIVGGLIPLNAAGRYVCPPLVVAGRQAVAKLKSVQLLRPQALPVKLLGVGAQCLVANVPCGAVREHTEKFSAAWFVAVHATVPLFAFMRKGVGMPKWAIAVTLASAILGQTIGSRLERHRLKLAAEEMLQREVQVKALSISLPQDLTHGCPLLRTCEQISVLGSSPAPLQPAFLESHRSITVT